MKKALVLLALSLTMLPAMAAYQRLYITGYRIGDSEIMANDDHRIVATNCNGEVKTDSIALTDNRLSSNAWFFASVPKGEEVIRWVAYDKDPTPPNCLSWPPTQTNSFAGAVTEYVWSYNPKDTANRYIVVDYDYITYTLKYNGSGAAGSMPSESHVYTNSFKLAANQFARTGYSFESWTNAVGAVFADKASVSGESFGVTYTNAATRTATLYAKWTPNTYTVPLDRQSGTGGSASVTATYGAAMPSITLPTRTGYTFGGYFTETNGSGTQYYTAAGKSARVWDKDAKTTLYAKWTAKTCIVTFDQQSGTGGSTSVTATYDSAMPTATMPTRTGYTFGGYFTAENGIGTQYYTAAGKSARAWNKTAATTLYAKWTAKTYAVTLDWQDGSSGTPSVTATYGSEMPTATMPTRTGYTFDGYYTIKNGGGVKYYNADGSSVKGWDIDINNPVLYANWTPVTYTVTLDRQGGSGGDSSAIVTYDAGMPQVKVPERTGYDFAGYYTDVNGGGTQYYASNGTSARKWDMTASTTLYAKWTANKYTVTLDKQGGTGGSTSVNATYDSAMPSATMPTRTGYTFGGYYTGQNGNGVQYYNANGESAQDYNLTTETNLFAKWTANTYSVIFDKNSDAAEGTIEGEPFTYAVAQALISNAFTRVGYTFAGWAKSGGGSVTYTDGQVVSNLTTTAGGIVTLYAKWTANEYTVTVGAGEGGSGGTTFCYTVSNSSQTKTIALPTRAGYHIVDWVISNYGGTAPSVNDRTVTIPGNTYGEFTMTPTWAANSYYVKFNKKSGDDGDMGNQEFQYDAAQALSPNLFSRTGYSFAGWATNQNGTAVYADGQIVSNLTAQANGTVYIYATWTPKTYAVTLNANGGAVDPTSVDVTYDDAWPTLPTPTLDGYAFAGWYDDAEFNNATRTNYNVAVTNAATIYAKWTANDYTVTFDANGGDGGAMSDQSFMYDTPQELTTNAFTKTGYSFAGWATSAADSVEYVDGQIVSNLTATAGGTVTLYATWTPIAYRISFSGNGANSGSVGDIEAAYDVECPLPDNGFAKAGRSFRAWQLGLDGDTYKVGDSVSNLTTTAGATVTFYAVWSEPRYVAFDDNGADNPNSMTGDVMVFEGAEAKMLVANKFEKTGYTFSGWATNETDAASLMATYGNGAEVAGTELNAPIGETNTFYAVWDTNVYTVVFHANGGAGSMDPMTIYYDQETNLSAVAFSSPNESLWVFDHWSNDVDGVAFSYTNRAVVLNLATEDGATVDLYAIWRSKLSDLSKAMHCDNLVWESTFDKEKPQWEIAEGAGEGYNLSGSSVSNQVDYDQQSQTLRPLVSSGAGKLSFAYKMAGDSANSWLTFKSSDTGNNGVRVDWSQDWNGYGPIDVSDISTVQIFFYGNEDADLSTVWIDQMTWVPDSVEPTDEDKPTISGFTKTTDGFALTVDQTNISDSFSYQILATNELVNGDWPVKTNLTAEAIKAGYDIVPEANEPKMFYKVKVISK